MKKYLFSTLLLLTLSSPIIFAADDAVTPAAAPAVVEPAAVESAPVATEAAAPAEAAKVDPRDAIKEKRAEHQKYMQGQRKAMREVKNDEERRALIEAQREHMQEYMEEMHELMRAAQQEVEGEPEESSDEMMPPPYYGPRAGWGGAPYGEMPRMPYGYGPRPRGWDRPSMNQENAVPPCQRGSNGGQYQGHYEEMQKRLDRIEKFLENLQAK
jgi:chromosome segregation ATPase